MTDTFLDNVSVVELGSRLGVGLCGGLLQRLGADVLVVEPTPSAPTRDSKWAHRPLLTAGKQTIKISFSEACEVAALADLIGGADVILISSDRDATDVAAIKSVLDAAPVVCDITAFGHSGPCAGKPYSDLMVQAMAGLMDTTGSIGGPPTASKVPIAESSAAVFAAAGVLCALRGRRMSAVPHRVDVAMFDAAVSMLSTFLPGHFAGASPQRMGNRHPSMSPWNAYRARDGWLLLCSASNEMWKRVCRVIDRRDLEHSERYATMPGRVKYADEVDAALSPWIRHHGVQDCVEKFTTAGVPCGPVYTIRELLADTNLLARGAFVHLHDAASGAQITTPGPLLRGSRANGRSPAQIPQPRRPNDSERREPPRAPRPVMNLSGARPDAGMLAGVRVLEMGSYTTAPLAARNLGALGAYVVKLEPPAGELSRASPPHIDGQSYFCTLSNSDKRCVAVDLQTDEGKSLFAQLLAKADVFVENMKPGALERFGFSRAQLETINPALVYCSVSGFGAGSPLAGRPAMDSTIQGMAGIMDLTRQHDTPCKVGISISDIAGGQFALLAVLAALEYRERTGKGQFIDLSMQEVSAWLTQLHWEADADARYDGHILQCSDGYVYVAGEDAAVRHESLHAVPAADTVPAFAAVAKVEAARHFAARGRQCVPVNAVSEVATHPQTVARELIVQGLARDGKSWPLLACPIRLRPWRTASRRAIGAVGADLDEVLQDWDIENGSSRTHGEGKKP